MIPYLKVSGKQNHIFCNCDLAVIAKGNGYNNDAYPILLSLVDIGVRVKKVIADFCAFGYNKPEQGVTYLRDKDDPKFMLKLLQGTAGYTYKSTKSGDLTHIMLLDKSYGEYVFDWNNAGRSVVVSDYLQQKHFLPISSEIVDICIAKQTSTRYNWLDELIVMTSNPKYKNLHVYRVNVRNFATVCSMIDNYHRYDSDFDWDKVEDIEDYIFAFTDQIKERLYKNIKVLYNPDRISPYMFEGNKKPFNGQISLVQAGIEVLKHDRFVYYAAEQGIGKTPIASWVNHCYFKDRNKQGYKTLIVAPAITLTQWRDEIKACIADNVDIVILRSTHDFITEYAKERLNPVYFIVGKETFKLDSPKRPGVLEHTRKLKRKMKVSWGWRDQYERIETHEQTLITTTCPICGSALANPNRTTEDVFFTLEDFKKPNKGNYRCDKCKAVLWQMCYDKTKKTSVINYIKTKNLMFDSLIVDEAHESNNTNSIIGNATRTLFGYAKKIILLSGTTNNGYSSSLHNLLMGLLSRKMIEDKVEKEQDFINKYGTLKAVNKRKDEEISYYQRGRSSLKDSDFHEVEGINSVVYAKYLAGNYIFANLLDLGKELPELKEVYIECIASKEQEAAENTLSTDIKEASKFNYKMYEDSIIKHFVNNPFSWNAIPIENGEESFLIQPKSLYRSVILPKEKKLLEICQKEKKEGRKVWIYTDYTGEGSSLYMQGENIPERLKAYLTASGLKVFWLKTNVAPIDRKELIEKNKDLYDVFISNPKLVQVGINMVWCPTYVFYMPSYHVNVVDQASRRGYRINSDKEGRIYHLYYSNSCEQIIMNRFQLKKAESKAIESRFNVSLGNEDNRTVSKFGKKISEGMK